MSLSIPNDGESESNSKSKKFQVGIELEKGRCPLWIKVKDNKSQRQVETSQRQKLKSDVQRLQRLKTRQLKTDVTMALVSGIIGVVIEPSPGIIVIGSVVIILIMKQLLSAQGSLVRMSMIGSSPVFGCRTLNFILFVVADWRECHVVVSSMLEASESCIRFLGRIVAGSQRVIEVVDLRWMLLENLTAKPRVDNVALFGLIVVPLSIEVVGEKASETMDASSEWSSVWSSGLNTEDLLVFDLVVENTQIVGSAGGARSADT